MSCCSLSAASASVGSSTSLRRTCSTRRPRQPRRTRRFGEGQGGGGGMGRADEPNTRGFRGQRRAFVFFRVVCVESAPARGGLIERRPRRHANRARVSPNKCSGSVSMPPQPFDRFHLLLSGLGAFAEFASGLGFSARQRTRFVPPRGCMRRLVDCISAGPQRPGQPHDPPLSVRPRFRTLRTQLSACSARK